MITKEQAYEVLQTVNNPRSPGFSVAEAVRVLGLAGAFDALDNVGAEATLSEIADVAREILRPGSVAGLTQLRIGQLAIRLATACRKAGLVR